MDKHKTQFHEHCHPVSNNFKFTNYKVENLHISCNEPAR